MGIWEKWNSFGLVPRICVGLVVGAILGLVIPSDGSVVSSIITLLGTLFVSALKAIAPLLVFFLVIGALANAKGHGNMGTIIALYLISTFIAAIVAVIGSFLFPIPLTLTGVEAADLESPQGVGQVLTTLITNMVANPVSAIVNANFIGVLLWAVLIGIAMRHVKDEAKQVVADIAEALTQVVRWIISCAPFGILGLVYDAVAKNGPEIFIEYGQLILLLVGCMLFIAFVTNPLMSFILTRKNPYPLSIPLGATIDMARAAVTITVLAMAAAYTNGIQIDFGAAVVLSALAAISACGASGVPGGSLLLIPMACALFGIPTDMAMHVVGVGFIISVIQDSCETALNSSSDVLFTATAEYREWIHVGRSFTMGKDNVPLSEAEPNYTVVATNME